MMNGVLVVVVICIFTSYAQDSSNGVLSITKGLDSFALKLLAQTSRDAGDNLNIALSPYTIWTLLAIISEGARDNTLRELETALGLPPGQGNKNAVWNNFRQLSNNFRSNSQGVRLDITNAIFTTNEYDLIRLFRETSERVYNVDIMQVDFKNAPEAVNTINNYISRATNNRIPNFVNTGDVQDATIFMTSALFFKGRWRNPFNKTATANDIFYDDAGNRIGNVQMMYQAGPFPYTMVPKLKAFAVELPYGDDNKYSMVVLVPRKDVRLSEVLDLVAASPVSELLENLARAEQDFVEEDVEVFLPKFSIQSELNLDSVLNKIGIKEAFSAEKANLLGIFPQYLYLSRVLQKAVIDVDEEGTVAAAASGASFAYKTMQPKLIANKPFAFFIIDKVTESILFAGKISNPNGICDKCTRNL